MIELRDYQAKAFGAICREIEAGGSTLLVLPTGTGKTVVFGTVAKCAMEDWGDNVLILAHRGELLQQAAEKLELIGVRSAMEKAEMDAMEALSFRRGLKLFDPDGEADGDGPACVVGSVQTLQRDRLRRWSPGFFGLVIVDEAHHAAAGSYRAIVDHLKPKRVLGVTATWDRADKDPIVGKGRPFETLAYEYPIDDAVREGYLARPIYKVLPTSVDLKAIRTTAGDLNAADLEEAIKPHVQELVNESAKYLAGNERSIVFTPDVGSADAVASAYRSVGLAAESISGDRRDRDEILAAFRSGRHRVLVNCALLTEGFDAPFVSRVVMMRPTKSRSLMVQMIGRGTRLHPGKECCMVIGFNWKTFKHQLVHPVQLFHKPDADPETTALAQGLIDSGECADLMHAIEKAKVQKAEKDAAEERRRLSVSVQKQKGKARAVTVDPLGDLPLLGIHKFDDSDRVESHRADPMTEKQAAALLRFGFDPHEIDGWSKKRAGAVMDAMIGRAQKKLCTRRQAKTLVRVCGLEPGAAYKLSFEAAKAKLDARFGNRRAG